MKSPNQLGHRGNFALVTWIQHNLPRFQTEHPSDDLVAQQATEALGFEVRRGNIRTVRNEFGWKWCKPKAPRSATRKAVSAAALMGLQSDFAQLAEKVAQLARIIGANLTERPEVRAELDQLATHVEAIAIFPNSAVAGRTPETFPLFQPKENVNHGSC